MKEEKEEKLFATTVEEKDTMRVNARKEAAEEFAVGRWVKESGKSISS